MNGQDCLTYLLEALFITFACIALFDFLTGLLALFNLEPKAMPNPVDIAPIFESVDEDLKEICQSDILPPLMAMQ